MIQHQSGFTVNQEDLFDAIKQAVHHHNFGKRTASAERFDAPLNAAPRKAVLKRFIERLEHSAQSFGDGFADGRTHHGE